MIHQWTRKQVQNKWTMEKALNIQGLALQKLSLAERAELANFLQSAFKRRVASFKRAKNYSHPYAYDKLMDEFKELKEAEGYKFDFNSPIITTRGRNRRLAPAYEALDYPAARLMSYIVNMQEFFNSKSSTVSGWRDIIRNESMKLFGYKTIHSKKGDYIRLNHMMSEDERIALWKLYRELKDSGAIAVTQYASESMKSTGFTRIWSEGIKENVWNYDDLTYNLNLMKAALKLGGIPVRDIPEHKPGLSKDPTRLDLADDEDSVEFQW